MKKIYIFGCGRGGMLAYQLLKNEYLIIGFLDNNESLWNSHIDGMPVFSPEQTIIEDGVAVIVAVPSHYYEITKQLFKSNIKNVVLFLVYYYAESLVKEYALYDVNKRSIIKQSIILDECNYSHFTKVIGGGVGNKKRILFLSYLFAPVSGGGVMRAVKLVKYLRQEGYDVTVLSSGIIDYFQYAIDVNLMEEVAGADIRYIGHEPWVPEYLSKEENEGIAQLYDYIGEEGGCYRNEADIEIGDYRTFLPDNEIVWVNRCIDYINSNIDMGDYDVLLTTSSPYASVLGGYYLKKRYGIKWVADIRDPWCENEYILSTYYTFRKKTVAYEKNLETRLLGECDKIVVISDVMVDNLDGLGVGDKAVCITNGYDEDDFVPERNIFFPKFTICYSGSLYGTRNAEPLLQAINEMIDAGKIERDKIQWIINGNLSAGLVASFKDLDCYSIIVIGGNVSHADAVMVMRSSNLLISYGEYGQGAYLTWTGKIFEYFRSCVPILSFSSPYGVQHDTLSELNQGITALPTEKERISQFILSLYNDWKNGNTKKWGDIEKAKRFDRRNIARAFARIFDEI